MAKKFCPILSQSFKNISGILTAHVSGKGKYSSDLKFGLKDFCTAAKMRIQFITEDKIKNSLI
jgi:hypothetical protein